jgi:hypothetical protein
VILINTKQASNHNQKERQKDKKKAKPKKKKGESEKTFVGENSSKNSSNNKVQIDEIQGRQATGAKRLNRPFFKNRGYQNG